MAEFLSLVRLHVTNFYGLSALRHAVAHDRRDAARRLGLGALVAVVVVSLAASYAVVLGQVFGPLRAAHLEQLVLLAGVTGPLAMVLVCGFFNVLGTVFFARDSAFLASLPVSQATVFAAKLSLVAVDQFLLAAPLLAIPSVYYGVHMHSGVDFYVRTAVLAVLLPAIPIAVACLVALPLMRVVSAVKRRGQLMTIGGFIAMVALVMGQMALTRYATHGAASDVISGIAKDQASLLASLTRYIPPVDWAVKALSSDSANAWLHMGMFAVAAAAGAGLAVWASSFIYQKGALAQNETAKSGNTEPLRATSMSSVTWAIFVREWKVLLRTPAYATNSLMFVVLGPILLNRSLLGGMTMQDPRVKPMFDKLAEGPGAVWVALLVAAAMALVGLVNTVASTTVSREGRMFWVSKVIPVRASRQVLAKYMAGYSVSALCVATSAPGLLWSFHLPLAPAVAGVALALVAFVPLTAAYVAIDILNPKLTWDNTTQAIKQNVNTLFAMALGVAGIAGPGYLAYRLAAGGMGMVALVPMLMAFYAALAAWLCPAMLRLADRRYPTISA